MAKIDLNDYLEKLTEPEDRETVANRAYQRELFEQYVTKDGNFPEQRAQLLEDFRAGKISTHAPLAGRDSKSVQITMHIFAITDKFQMLLHRMPPVRAFCSFLMQENHADFGCEPPK